MSNLWERFESIATAEEVENAKPQYTPIEAGNYFAVLESIQPAESQNGMPMLKGKFRTVEGNRVIFYNQMLQNLNSPDMTAVNIAEAVAFVGALLDEEVTFKGMGKFAEVVESVPTGGLYTIKISYGKKDLEMKYPKIKIVNKLEEVPFE